MAGATKDGEIEKTRIMLGLLESVERGGEQSQRRLASELGIALGLVNAYLKRCISKGLVKVGEAPARRYAYYLTLRLRRSRGSRSNISHLSLFRGPKRLHRGVGRARSRGFTHLSSVSDLAKSYDLRAGSGISIAALSTPSN